MAGASEEAESVLSAYFDEYASSERSGLTFLARDPARTLQMLRLARELPLHTLAPSESGEGPAIRAALAHDDIRVKTPLHRIAARIEIPDDLAEYQLGSSKQTLRRKARDADRRGITWRPVTDEDERRRLLALSIVHESENPRELYRNAEPDNDDLLAIDLWLVAVDAAGVPILLSVTPIDGEWAALRYFRTLRADDDASVSRYLLTQVLVGELHRRGVRYLADTTLAMHLYPGLRHFQRMVGFRLARIEL